MKKSLKIVSYNVALLLVFFQFFCSELLKSGGVQPDAPNPVELLKPVKVYASGALLSWYPTSSKYFSSYSVYYDTVPEVSETSILAASVTIKDNTELLLTGLMDETEYYVKVFTYNSASMSASNEISFRTKVCESEEFTNQRKYGMVLIPSGCFIGKDTSMATITHNFYIDTTEVTEQEWDRVVGGDTITSLFPKVEISWFEMVLFCNEKSKLYKLDTCFTYSKIIMDTAMDRIQNLEDLNCSFQNNGFRLPTEDEWEHAYRAGQWEEYFWGRDGNTLMVHPYTATYPVSAEHFAEVGEYAWWDHNNFPDGAKQVGQLKPNKWHLYDMAGNVMEFVWDLASEKRRPLNRFNYPGPKPEPQGIFGRLARGGRFDNNRAKDLTAWYRGTWIRPEYDFKKNVGFRTVVTATQ